MKTFIAALALSIAALAAAVPSQASGYNESSPEWIKTAFSQYGD